MFVPEVDDPTCEQMEERMSTTHPLGIPHTQPSRAPQARLFVASAAAPCTGGGPLPVSGGLSEVNAR
jgi:hypothetical protein